MYCLVRVWNNFLVRIQLVVVSFFFAKFWQVQTCLDNFVHVWTNSDRYIHENTQQTTIKNTHDNRDLPILDWISWYWNFSIICLGIGGLLLRAYSIRYHDFSNFNKIFRFLGSFLFGIIRAYSMILIRCPQPGIWLAYLLYN